VENRILIDAIHIHSLGGKRLLEYLIKSINQKKLLNNILFFFDKRLDLESNPLLKKCNFYKINPRISSRILAYKRYSKDFNTIVCLSNIPPPYKIRDKIVYVYFHNLLLIQSFSNELKDFITNKLKKIYIKQKNIENYNWIVQTDYMKEQLSRSLLIKRSQIEVLPFFDITQFKKRKKFFNDSTINFLYVTSNLKHKNIEKLIRAFKSVTFQNKKTINLYITVDGGDIFIDKKRIFFVGNLDKNNLVKFYQKTHYLIYPSFVESLGLPILEAIKSGCNVIVSEIPTFKSICNPSLFINPNSVESIRESIEKAINVDYINQSNIVVKNKIDNFIELIFKNVQK